MHITWCPKYRRKLIGPDEIRFDEIIAEVIAENGKWVVDLEAVVDHVHLLVEVDPQFEVHRLRKDVKGRSSRMLREEFSWLSSKLPSLWTDSCFVAKVGGAPLSVIKRYVAAQRDR